MPRGRPALCARGRLADGRWRRREDVVVCRLRAEDRGARLSLALLPLRVGGRLALPVLRNRAHPHLRLDPRCGHSPERIPPRPAAPAHVVRTA